MKKSTLAGILGLTVLSACSTTPPTAQERMANIFLSYDESDKQLAAAEKDLLSFEKSVKNLRATATQDKNMRTKSAYDSTLSILESNLQQAHQALQDLKVTNQNGRAESQRQIEKAASQMQDSSDRNQGK
jgi:predicted  nucleic acid-binding Zn-ribbon protein